MLVTDISGHKYPSNVDLVKVNEFVRAYIK